MDSGHPPDHRQGTQSTHYHPGALSLREAAAQAGVTEKTIRRWIKSERLVAQMRGGQYWVAIKALERAQAAPPRGFGLSTQENQHEDQAMSDLDMQRVHGHDTPRVDLHPLVDHIARLEGKVQELTEAATVWQFRALQAEERVRALEAGPLIAPEATVTANEKRREAITSTTTDDPGLTKASLWDRFRRWYREL
jgi:hypothetical protein